jgi:hypothetical protein
MKKILFRIIFSSFLIFNSLNLVYAGNILKVAVFPVDRNSQGANVSIYPVTVGMISNDLANSLTMKYNIPTLSGSVSQSKIKSAGLNSMYRKMIENFQSTYTVDYNSCQIIAEKLGVDRILLVSGGYDIQNMLLQPDKLTPLSIAGLQTIKPAYALHIMLTLVDPQSGTVIWENTYKKNIINSTFPAPSAYFGDNVDQTDKVKTFSYEVSQKASMTLANILLESGFTQVDSHIITTSGQSVDNSLKDGITTMDGHLYSTKEEDLRSNRTEKFKNWVKTVIPE